MAIRRPHMNPKLRAYLKYFGKGFYVVLAVLVVAGLIALTFYYGNKHKNEVANTTSTQKSGSHQAIPSRTSRSSIASQSASTNNTASNSASNSNTGSSSAQSNSSSTSHTSTQRSPSLPGQVPDTGPADFAPLAIVLIVVLTSYYLKTRKSLASASQPLLD